jgi:prolipoprotein diacylglyceryltransferase
VPRGPLLGALAWAIPIGVLSARVVYVLGWWDYYLTRPTELWQLGINGLALWGGLVGGGLAAAITLRHDRALRRRVFDIAAPGALLGIAIAQVGAFLEGAGQGLPSDLPWATQYTSPLAATPDFGVPRHPAQLYEALVALALFGVLTTFNTAGARAALFLVIFGLARVALGGVRLEPLFLFGLQIEQLLAIGAIGVGVIIGLRMLRQMKVRLLGKRDCHLCEAAQADLRRLQGRYPHQLEVVDISSDSTLLQQYGERIPVVQVNGREYDAPLTSALLERALSGRA